MKKLFLITIFSFFGLSGILGQPTITSFTPTSGYAWTTVTINGSNFNATPSNNIVFFGATMATVASGSTTSLSVTAPISSTFQNISVTDITTGLTGYSTQPFITTFSNSGVINSSSFATKTDFTAGSNPTFTSIGDLNGDGKLDLAATNTGNNTLSIFKNTSTSGTVSFATKVDIAIADISCVTIGDINGDSKPDLIVSKYDSIAIFKNTSTGGVISFAPRVLIYSGSTYQVSIGDLDGDGKPDLAAAGSNVTVFRNTGTTGVISFAPGESFSVGMSPQRVSISDYDGDGKPDLAVANSSSNKVSVLRNISTTGDISFAAKIDYTTGTYPSCVDVASGDLDGDGKCDLAVVNYDDYKVSVFLNNSTSGTISFGSRTDYTAGTYPIGIAIGDLNGDGKPDIVVSNETSNNICVFKNTCTSGTISFAAKVNFTTGFTPGTLNIADIDGNGKPDIVVENYNSNTVSVLRNTVVAGIKENPMNYSFDLYPNPANNTITIETKEMMLNGSLVICDINGRDILTQPLSFFSTTIDISQLSKGIYFAKVISDQGVGIKMVVKE